MNANIRTMPASKAYETRAEQLLSLVRMLEDDVTDSLVDAHAAHWGHIGDLGRAIDLAQQLQDLLRGKTS